MIINGKTLGHARPIVDMEYSKQQAHGTSYGLSEAGYDIRIKQSVWLHPFKRFALASTVERFQIPKYMAGIVHDKSTWARRGLSVFNTVIEPDWRGFLTLELVYHGWKPLRIPAGAGIAQVIFHRTEEIASYANGKYQDQADRPVGARR
tara:strand:+ start:93 stop:539 length:447 start_codon:yes stop_codon:yes gene_type:complete